MLTLPSKKPRRPGCDDRMRSPEFLDNHHRHLDTLCVDLYLDSLFGEYPHLWLHCSHFSPWPVTILTTDLHSHVPGWKSESTWLQNGWKDPPMNLQRYELQELQFYPRFPDYLKDHPGFSQFSQWLITPLTNHLLSGMILQITFLPVAFQMIVSDVRRRGCPTTKPETLLPLGSVSENGGESAKKPPVVATLWWENAGETSNFRATQFSELQNEYVIDDSWMGGIR